MSEHGDETIYELAKGMLLDEGEQDIADCLSEDEVADVDSLEPPIEMDETFPRTVLLGNVPQVGKDKYDKLEKLIRGHLRKAADAEDDVIQFEMPFDPENENGHTYGCVIATFDDHEKALAVATHMNGMNLDKKHKYKAVLIDKFDEIVQRPDVLRAQHTVTRLPRGDFRGWLGDPKCREQILMRYKNETEVYWHDPMVGGPVPCYGGENQKAGGKIWCDWKVAWSPQGSYITTFHKLGCKVWAGPDFTTAIRLPHLHVQEIDWSPNEEFIILWNGSHQSSEPEEAVKIYEVLTGRCVRTCRTPKVCPTPGSDFPHFLWSSDGKFLAEMSDFRILVRDTKTWELIEGAEGKPAPLKFNNLQTFQWSPKGNVLAAWTLEKDNSPARLTLLEIPSRRELASRSRTQCEAVMHWQSQGDYLCLQVTKLSKTGKKIATNIEILRVREKLVPVDVVTIEEDVKGFFWESKGRRFAVLTADEQNTKPKLLIYVLGTEKCEKIVEFPLPSASFNQVVWAPEGQYFIAASTSQTNGDLLFAGVTADNKLEILHKDEHYMLTDVQWDPSSRYVITAVTQPISNEQLGYKYSMEAGYSLWTFQGRNLLRMPKEKLYHVSWRPHPPAMAEEARLKLVRKDLKTFSKQFDALDDKAKESARMSFRKERDEKIRSFKDVLNRLKSWKEEKEQDNDWVEQMEEFHGKMGWTQEEERTEELLDVSEVFIGDNS